MLLASLEQQQTTADTGWIQSSDRKLKSSI